MDTKRIGEFLRALRKERGLTQEQLAEILLVSGRTVSRWETGTKMAYGQDLGDAGLASARYGMGRGIDDRIAIIVSDEKEDSAKQVIKEMGLGQNVTF